MKAININKHYTAPSTVITPIHSYAVLQGVSGGLPGLQDGGQAGIGVIPQ